MSLDLDLDQFNDHMNGGGIGVDDVDSQDDDLTGNLRGNLNNNNGQNQAEKRAHHNALERKRRDHIKGSFNDLRDAIPSLKGEKASRAHVLKAATDYIRTIKGKNQQHQKVIEDFKRQNASLELQTRLLERVKETGQYTRQTTLNQQSMLKNEAKNGMNNNNNGIQTTRNLLTSENHQDENSCSLSSTSSLPQ